MPYNVRSYEDFRKGANGKLINDFTIAENAYSINLIGNGYEDFSQEISESFLWVSTNFENGESIPPRNPVVGQTWYDSSAKKLKVYGTDLKWTAVTTSLSNNLLVEDITPKEDATYDIGSSNFSYKEGYFFNVYAENIYYENSNGGTKDIFIDATQNTSLKKSTNLYPSVLDNASLMIDVDDLIETAENNSAVPWNTSTVYWSEIVNNIKTFETELKERDHQFLFVDFEDIVSGEVKVEVEVDGSIDSQITVCNNTIRSMEVYLRSNINVNYLHGAFTASGIISSAQGLPVAAGKTVKITTFKTNDVLELDVISGDILNPYAV